jgi:hypothetical protein
MTFTHRADGRMKRPEELLTLRVRPRLGSRFKKSKDEEIINQTGSRST